MFKIYKWDEFFMSIDTWEEVMKFVGARAAEYNYGIYRVWEIGGATYFDCGHITYKVEKEN